MKRLCRLMLLLIFVTSHIQAEQLVQTAGPQKQDDASHSYFINLLHKALGEHYSVVIRPHAGQGRAIELMVKDGFYDVVWTGEAQDRDSKLIRVPFPLFQGGLGIRGSIIQQKFKANFEKVDSLESLKNLRICQGHNWPDADILERAGLTVFRIVHFDSMLRMIALGRCDIFPLSIFEGQAELSLVAHRFPELEFNTNVLLSYPINMYFYVLKSKPALASAITKGLNQMQARGEYRQFMTSHPLTQSAFPVTKHHNATVIEVLSGNAFFRQNH